MLDKRHIDIARQQRNFTARSFVEKSSPSRRSPWYGFVTQRPPFGAAIHL